MKDAAAKLRVAVLFGGRSAEHDVSIMSATNVMHGLDADKYEAVPVFVTRQGRWLLSQFVDGVLTTPDLGTEIALIPGGKGRVMALSSSGQAQELAQIDVLFPVLHGMHGEDGAVQGLAEVAQVPMAGCGIIGSANALDKDVAKRLFQQAGIDCARSVTIHQGAVPGFDELVAQLGSPIFIKPARQGSTVGVGKAANEEQYRAVVSEAFKHDNKLLAEEFIQAIEVECGVLESPNRELFVSRCGAIVAAKAHDFYTYEAKYLDANGAKLTIPADIPADIEYKIQVIARQAFKALGCDGMARVDFFLTPDLRILLNELNTIPGFTNASMYAKVLAVSGISYPQVLDRLIEHGIARAA